MCRPERDSVLLLSCFPALTCRALDCPVPAGLRHSNAFYIRARPDFNRAAMRPFTLAVKRSFASRYAQLNPLRCSGSVLIRLPVAAKMALQTAGKIGGKVGSPKPVGA
jgi:hypothetical protein